MDNRPKSGAAFIAKCNTYLHGIYSRTTINLDHSLDMAPDNSYFVLRGRYNDLKKEDRCLMGNVPELSAAFVAKCSNYLDGRPFPNQ